MAPDGNAVAKVRYTHQALCDLIIARPDISQNEIASFFGYTPGWVSQLLSSDAVKEFLIERKAELTDPMLKMMINERLEGLAKRSIEVLQEKLEANPNAEVALKALEISTRALGYGAKAGVTVNQQFVVAMPTKADSSGEWLASRAGGYKPTQLAAITIDTVLE